MARAPIMRDCDPGVDDAIALLLALGSPEIGIRAITTVAGNVDDALTATNACRVLALAGREDIPVHAGRTRPLLGSAWRGKYSGAGGSLLPDPRAPLAPGHAVDVITAALEAAIAHGARMDLCSPGR